MGNLLSLAKECKAFLQEIPRILTAFIEVLFGVTRMLQDMEEIFIDLKEISDLLELVKTTCKESERSMLHQRATGLLRSTRKKLYHTAINESKYSEVLRSVEVIVSTLIDATETKNSFKKNDKHTI